MRLRAHYGKNQKGRNLAILRVESLEERTLLDGGLARFASWEAFNDYFIDRAVEQWKNYLGRTLSNYCCMSYSRGAVAASASFQVFDDDASALKADFSGTNLQELGVDEADMVKTDGEYLYVLSHADLVIIDAWPADEMQIVSRTLIEGQFIAQYLHGDRLTVISSGRGDRQVAGDDSLAERDGYYSYYDRWVKMTVFNVSDRGAPSEVQATYLDGDYVNSRAIGALAYVVVQNTIGQSPSPEFECAQTECTYETEAAYRARLEEGALYAAFPHFYSTGSVAGGTLEQSTLLSDAENIYQPLSPTDNALVSVAVFDVTSDQPGMVNSTSVMAAAQSTLYASTEHLYLVQSNWRDRDSSIYKLELDSGSVQLTASGAVPGQLLNQFSMDEEGAYFRIATTTGNVWDHTAANHVYVLAEDGDDLEVVGRIENLARGERIYAARFMADRGYLVTFIKVDPLFTLDLSDPANPRVVGELKIPGFSDYLQPIDENHLLAIGRGASDTGMGFAWYQELQVSVFDVSDFANPTLLHRYSLEGGRTAESNARYDHHAFMYFPEYQTLAIPVDRHPGEDWVDTDDDGVGDSWIYRADEERHEVQLFKIDIGTGIDFLGSVQHDSPIHRSVRIENVLYSLSTNDVKAHAINDPSTQISEVALREGEARFKSYCYRCGDWVGGMGRPMIIGIPVTRPDIDLTIQETEPPEDTTDENDPPDENAQSAQKPPETSVQGEATPAAITPPQTETARTPIAPTFPGREIIATLLRRESLQNRTTRYAIGGQDGLTGTADSAPATRLTAEGPDGLPARLVVSDATESTIVTESNVEASAAEVDRPTSPVLPPTQSQTIREDEAQSSYSGDGLFEQLSDQPADLEVRYATSVRSAFEMDDMAPTADPEDVFLNDQKWQSAVPIFAVAGLGGSLAALVASHRRLKRMQSRPSIAWQSDLDHFSLD